MLLDSSSKCVNYTAVWGLCYPSHTGRSVLHMLLSTMRWLYSCITLAEFTRRTKKLRIHHRKGHTKFIKCLPTQQHTKLRYLIGEYATPRCQLVWLVWPIVCCLHICCVLLSNCYTLLLITIWYNLSWWFKLIQRHVCNTPYITLSFYRPMS